LPYPKKFPKIPKLLPAPTSKLVRKIIQNYFPKLYPKFLLKSIRQNGSPKPFCKATPENCAPKLLSKSAPQSYYPKLLLQSYYASNLYPKMASQIMQSGFPKLLPTSSIKSCSPELFVKLSPENYCPNLLFFKTNAYVPLFLCKTIAPK